MKKIMIGLLVLIILGSFIGAAGQMYFKKGINEAGEISFISSPIPTAIKLITNPSVLLAVLFSAISSVLWIVALSKSNLSFAYPVGTAFFCISVMFLSKIFLKETISLGSWLGALLVISGIIAISTTQK